MSQPSERQATRVSLTIGSTRRLTEFDFSKISLSLERDLAPTENPLDGFRGIHALLSKALVELQVGPKTQVSPVGDKPKSPTVSDNHAVSPRPAVSKLVTLQERLGARLQDLEVVEGFDGLCVKPKSYLGDRWKDINDVVRALGGKWQKGNTPKDGSWRIPK